MIKQINPIVASITGWKSDGVIGKHATDVFIIIDEITRLPAENPIISRLKEDRIVELANHPVLISKDGTELVVEDSVAPIRNHMGKVFGAMLVFRDVTAAKMIRR